MDISHIKLDPLSDIQMLKGIVNIHKKIFNGSENLSNQMESKEYLFTVVALNDSEVIGYKIGYAFDENTFYSWLGGVDDKYRNYGIASKLMEKQHGCLNKSGYKKVQTKTKNKWWNMLILNIKNDFDVIGTYTDNSGEHKFILEKKMIF